MNQKNQRFQSTDLKLSIKRIDMDKAIDRDKLAKELESELKEMKEEHDIAFAGIFL